MILGDTCTRACGFCNVKTGRPAEVDHDEPRRVAESIALMGLGHVVITCVDRDDLPDGGIAAIWAETIERVHEACPDTSVECLIGDHQGRHDELDTIIAAKPEILSHNMETVRRMHPAVRPQARYERSIDVLQHIRESGLVTKTGIMVGIGERDEEVFELMQDLRDAADIHILTVGQYLQPTRNHLPIDRWVTPESFDEYRESGLNLGFSVVESGPWFDRVTTPRNKPPNFHRPNGPSKMAWIGFSNTPRAAANKIPQNPTSKSKSDFESNRV